MILKNIHIIKTEKINKKKEVEEDENEDGNKIEEEKVELSEEEKIKKEYEEFKLQQQKLDNNKEYSFLDGKVTVKEMILDQKRVMKNYVRDFYYVKKENSEQVKDFQLEMKENVDITTLIMEDYDCEC